LKRRRPQTATEGNNPKTLSTVNAVHANWRFVCAWGSAAKHRDLDRLLAMSVYDRYEGKFAAGP
jgi:hypothetical protein